MYTRALCLGFALLCPLLAVTAWPRALPQQLLLEQSRQALQHPPAAASQQAAQLLEDLNATASSTLDGQYFGAHHLFDGNPDTCWIGGAGAASWTLTIALGDI